ncbi:MAG: aminotransferase class V-fold PLP-dependent enzyme [Desulfobacterales bacterium]|nr:aminotransferase class V-fold PLP-dependent enzyme [Desulfobacterales bacterium]
MIYLNNATTSFPKPESVIEAVNRYNQRPPMEASRFAAADDRPDLILECRKNLSRLFKVSDPENIIFTSGATHSLNLALLGLLRPGDHVVTTRIEHNSVLRVLKTLEKDREITLSIVPCDSLGHVSPADIRSCLKKDTRAVVVNHCSNVTGRVQDIKTIGRMVRDHPAVFIVDGAQSAGAIDINMEDLAADVFVFTGHKSLFGMQGTGGLYMSREVCPEPLIIGGTGVKSDYLYQPRESPFRYEAGTPNTPGIVSLNAGVSFLLKCGIESVRKKKNALKQTALDSFLNNPAVTVYGGTCLDDFSGHEAIIGFNLKDIPPDEAGYILTRSFGIICRSGLHCAPLIHEAIGTGPAGCLRVSFSYFNTEQEVEGLIHAVDEITAVL